MTSPLSLAALRCALENTRAGAEQGAPATRDAAVAGILREPAGRLELLFIRRAEHPRDPWSGHMALPGGRIDPIDAGPLGTAIRETREEVALDLDRDAELIGRLAEVRTHLPIGKAPRAVIPFVFALGGEPPLTPNHEVQEALWVPLEFLADKRNRSTLLWSGRGLPLPFPCYRYEGRVIWGLTLRIVHQLLGLIGRAAE